jgi:murein DD-endopeptidase MepM/ murein hydrolase activator NlpD
MFNILKKVVAVCVLGASILTLAISSSTITTDAITVGEQNQLATNMGGGKKILKKAISLEYTNPKFETDLNSNQKEAILKALKKWKIELPIDNKFTVTSIADLKSNTTDKTKTAKKTKNSTPDSQVIYMWAKTPNTAWDKNKAFDEHDYEEGDPSIIRTEFNILLKKTKNGGYKASIERDKEVKADSVEVVENAKDTKIHEDLFGTNINDNKFTGDSEVLIDSSSSVSSSSISTSTVSSSSVLDSTQTSTENSTQSPTSASTLSSTSKKSSWLDAILSFGSISASAGEYDYSWPWKSGDTWMAGQGWHTEFVNTTCFNNSQNLYYPVTGQSASGCAIDVQPYSTNASKDVLAPISSTSVRVCNDGLQGFLKFGDATRGYMSILHLNPNNMTSGVWVSKGTKVGTVNPNAVLRGSVLNQCGYSDGEHLHIKFSKSSMVIDGSTINWNTPVNTYTLFTSQNTTGWAITDPNITEVQPPQANWQWAMDNRCNGGDQVQIVMKWRDNGNCQKMRYNSSNNTISNVYGKCLDAGAINESNNRWLRSHNCHGGNNQKWKQDSNGRIWSFEKNSSNQTVCMQYDGLVDQYGINIVPCDNSQNQKWYFDLGITSESVPVATPNRIVSIRRTNTTKCIDHWGSYDRKELYMWDCNNGNSQKFEEVTVSGSTKIYKLYGTNNFCLDITNPQQDQKVYSFTCNNTAPQYWSYDTNTKLFQRAGTGNNGQCLAKWNPQNGDLINMYPCSSGSYNDPNLKWDLVVF